MTASGMVCRNLFCVSVFIELGFFMVKLYDVSGQIGIFVQIFLEVVPFRASSRWRNAFRDVQVPLYAKMKFCNEATARLTLCQI